MLNIPKLRRTMPEQVQVDFERVAPNFLTDRHCEPQMNKNILLTLMTAEPATNEARIPRKRELIEN